MCSDVVRGDLHARTSTFAFEQEQRSIWFYVIRADTQGSAKHGDSLFWVVMRHWFVVGYRRFGMVSSAA
jgi:hypothetical protein